MLVARNASEQHAAVLDRETSLHFGVGLGAGIFGVGVTTAVLLSIGAEMAYVASKDGARRAVFGKVIPASSLANHAADAVATVAGVYVGRWLARRA